MLDHINLQNLVCIDIETVPCFPQFNDCPDDLKELYLKKSERLKQEHENDDEQYFNHAGIYAEFGKVICVTLGLFKKEKNEYQLRIKSLCGDDEKKVLEGFAEILDRHPNRNRLQFCGHNVREFDIPFLCRRFLIHHLSLPALLDISGRKPWDVPMVDTMALWRFGDIKHFTSLKLLALILSIESPKTEMDGKDVGRVYWKENGLQRIVEYCQRDVVTVAQLVMRFKGLPLLKKESIVMTS